MSNTHEISQLHALASSSLDSGDVNAAESAYRRLCDVDRNNPEPWLTLGAICGERGNLPEAVQCIEECIRLKPDYAEAHMTLGHIMRAIGKESDALSCFLRAGRADYSYAEAHLAACTLMLEQEKYVDALGYLSEVLGRGAADAVLWKMAGWTQDRLGLLMESEQSYRNSLQMDNSDPDAHYGFGAVLQKKGDWQGALASYEHALSLRPIYANVYHSMALIHQANIGITSAIELLQKAIAQQPDFYPAHVDLARVLLKQGRFEEAIAHCESALEHKLNHEAALYVLGRSLHALGRVEDAYDCYSRKQKASASDSCLIRMSTILPVILDSNEQVDRLRKKLDQNLDDLLNGTLSVADPLNDLDYVNTFLVYHGRNDLGLQKKMSAVMLKACPGLGYIADHMLLGSDLISKRKETKISIGFISAFFSSHTIGEVMKGAIAKLPREIFEVTVLSIRQPDDENSRFIRDSADKYIELPLDLELARNIIASERLDVLFYTDIGMDTFTYYLAFSRLAPVQCTTWGHPVTTGIPTIDYYLSCKYFETEGAESHYSERLVLLENIPAYYYRPESPDNYSREYLGLPVGKHMYLCPQTLFKFHPDFDEYIQGILRKDNDGVVVLVESRHDYWLQALKQRFERNMGDLISRIIIRPYEGADKFKALLKAADVMLDTIHYGGGSTSLQALAYGTPIITRPGDYQRGRHTYAYYRKMDYLECVVGSTEEYIDKAVCLASDPCYREGVSSQILRRCGILYENDNYIEELGGFIKNAVANGVATQKS